MTGEAYYEFYIKGPKVVKVGYRPFISDALYNMELPGRPVNDYVTMMVYVGVYGSADKVNAVYGYLVKNRPANAEVSEITRPEKTSHPKHEIPRNLNDMHIHATHLTLSQMGEFVNEAQLLRKELGVGFSSMSGSINNLVEELRKKV